MDMKGKPLPEFSNEDWISDFAFLVDMTQHLNDLNLQLQGRNQLVNDIFTHVNAFEVKLPLWEIQLTNQNRAHFPTLNDKAKSVSFNVAKYATEIGVLREEFKSRFQDFRKHETYFRIFASPFETDVEAVPEKFQMELIELQSKEEIKSEFLNVPLLEFYKLYLPENNFPQLYRQAIYVNALFGSTYVCEQLFSKIKHSKSKLRSRLTDKHLHPT
jgi:hypothetical protein